MRAIQMAGLLAILTMPLLLAPIKAASAVPQTAVCTPEQENRVLTAVDKLKDWQTIYQSFKRFAGCDDGAISEGYSDAVAKMLANDWKDLVTFAHLASSDRGFEQFVLRHIDETDSEESLRRIADNARLHCPQTEKPYCSLIGDQAKRSLKKLDEEAK